MTLHETRVNLELDLKTGVTPSASGSAYLEIDAQDASHISGMKLSCTVTARGHCPDQPPSRLT